MKLRGKNLLVCNCEATMPLDAGKLAKACQAAGAEGDFALNTQLCRSQLGNFQAAVIGDTPVMTACTQEAPLFGEVAAEDNPQQEVGFVNIRETAGWSAEAGKATPKIAALIAAASEAAEPPPAAPLNCLSWSIVVPSRSLPSRSRPRRCMSISEMFEYPTRIVIGLGRRIMSPVLAKYISSEGMPAAPSR